MSILTLHKSITAPFGNAARNIEFSFDDTFLCVTSYDSNTYIFDVENDFDLIDTLNVTSERNRSLAWSPDGQYLAIGAQDDKVHVFNKTDLGDIASEVFSLAIGDGRINGLDFSNDSKWLAASDDTGRVLILDVNDNFSTKKVFTDLGAAYGMRWSGDNDFLAVTRGGGNLIFIIDTSDTSPDSWSLAHTLDATATDNRPCSSVDWIKNDRYLVSGNDSLIFVWDRENDFDSPVHTIDPNWSDNRVWRVRADNSDRWIIYASDDGVELIDIQDSDFENWSSLQVITDGSGRYFGLGWSITDKWCCVGTEQGELLIYSVTNPAGSRLVSDKGVILTDKDAIINSK